MAHWCDYQNFAESLKWLAEQDNHNIEAFLRSVEGTGPCHPVLPGRCVAGTPADIAAAARP